MISNILEKFDLKWWTSLEAQQKLTVGMAVIIFGLCGVSVILYRSNERNKLLGSAREVEIRNNCNIRVEKEKDRADSIYESYLFYVQENERRFQDIFFEFKRLETRVYENNFN